MADITAEEIIAVRAPQYQGNPRIPLLLELAEEFTGDKVPVVTPRENAKALLVLHWLSLDDRLQNGNAGVGAIQEEKEGELTVKYGNSSSNVMAFNSDMKGYLAQTVWGLELYAFLKRYIVLAVTRYT